MTTRALTITSTFLNELLKSPPAVQGKVFKTVKALGAEAGNLPGDVEKVKGFEGDIYRTRVGEYRLFFCQNQGWIKFLSVRKRDEHTYKTKIPDAGPPPPLPAAQAQEVDLDQLLATAEAERQQITVDPDELLALASIEGPPITTEPEAPDSEAFPLTPDLLHQWQIPREYWPGLIAAPTPDALLELDQAVPPLYLSRILDNLYSKALPEVLTEHEYLLQQPEDLERFVEGSLSAFLLKLDPDQEKLQNFGRQGPVLVKGGPGTGKSTLAIHRVRRLLELGFESVLFTTYTKALVTYSEQLLRQLLGQPPGQAGVKVTTVDALALEYFRRAHGKPKFATDAQAQNLLQTALHTAELSCSHEFDRQGRLQSLERLGLPYLWDEIREVLEGWGIATLADYLAIERPGRKTPLPAKLREALWSVYQTWQALMAEGGYITWGQMRWRALELARCEPPPYQALVIDEAQDLSPVALRFLLALVPNLEGVYLTADAAQSIYRRGFSWNQIHQELQVRGRTLILKQNYRNTAQILAACHQILTGEVEEFPTSSRCQGEPPLLVLTDQAEDEIKAITEFLRGAAKHHRLPLAGGALLCPNTSLGQEMAERLSRSGLKAQFLTSNQIDLDDPHVKVLTIHAAKGLEFPFVVVAGLEEGVFPSTKAGDPELEASVEAQRRLFYVGCSRAMRALLVCGSARHPSPLLAGLRPPHWQT